MSNNENVWDVGAALEDLSRCMASVQKSLDEKKAKQDEENEALAAYLESMAAEARKGEITALFVVSLAGQRVRYSFGANDDDAAMRLVVASQSVLNKKINTVMPDPVPASEDE